MLVIRGFDLLWHTSCRQHYQSGSLDTTVDPSKHGRVDHWDQGCSGSWSFPRGRPSLSKVEYHVRCSWYRIFVPVFDDQTSSLAFERTGFVPSMLSLLSCGVNVYSSRWNKSNCKKFLVLCKRVTLFFFWPKHATLFNWVRIHLISAFLLGCGTFYQPLASSGLQYYQSIQVHTKG